MKNNWFVLLIVATALLLLPLFTSAEMPGYGEFLIATYGDVKLLAAMFSLSILVFFGVLLMDMKENMKQGD